MADTAYIFDDAPRCGSEVFREYMGYLFTNGVFGEGLKVTSKGGMQIGAADGYGHINGAVRYFDAEQVITLSVASSANDRIDMVVLEYNEPNRDVTIKLLQGSPGDPPALPELTRSGGVYQIPLAQISIRRGVVGVTDEDITDMREQVRGRIREIDFSQLNAAMESLVSVGLDEGMAAFDEWYETVYSAEMPLPDGTSEKIDELARYSDEFVEECGGRIDGIESAEATTRARADDLTALRPQFMYFDFSKTPDILISAADYPRAKAIILYVKTNETARSLGKHYSSFGTNAFDDYNMPSPIYLVKDQNTEAFTGHIAMRSHSYYGDEFAEDCIYGHIRINFKYLFNSADLWGIDWISMWGQFTHQEFIRGGRYAGYYSGDTPSDKITKKWICGSNDGQTISTSTKPGTCNSISEFNEYGLVQGQEFSSTKQPFTLVSAQVICTTE